MSLPLPRNAQAIVDVRNGGLKPELPVFVSYVGTLPVSNPTVYADSGKRYEWRWLNGLVVFIAVAAGVDARDAMRGALAEMGTMYPTLIDYEKQHISALCGMAAGQLMHVRRYSPMWQEHFA